MSCYEGKSDCISFVLNTLTAFTGVILLQYFSIVIVEEYVY